MINDRDVKNNLGGYVIIGEKITQKVVSAVIVTIQLLSIFFLVVSKLKRWNDLWHVLIRYFMCFIGHMKKLPTTCTVHEIPGTVLSFAMKGKVLSLC